MEGLGTLSGLGERRYGWGWGGDWRVETCFPWLPSRSKSRRWVMCDEIGLETPEQRGAPCCPPGEEVEPSWGPASPARGHDRVEAADRLSYTDRLEISLPTSL